MALSDFGRTKQKNGRSIVVKNSVSVVSLFKFFKLWLKTCGFPRFYHSISMQMGSPLSSSIGML